MARKTEKNCTNCHYGLAVNPIDCPCVRKGGCFYQEGYKNWQPMTNGDVLRRMSDRELAARLLAYRNYGKNVTLEDVVEWLVKEAKE